MTPAGVADVDAGAARVLVTDAQVHLWQPETPDRPWLPDGRSFAHGESFTVDELLPEMDRAGVDQVLLIPPSFEGDRNEVCLSAAQDHPERFRVMGRIALDDPDGPTKVASWRDTPGMLGIRLTFSKGNAQQWLAEGLADWLWVAAEAAHVPIMLSAPGQMAMVADVARRHPGLKLTIDHLGMRVGLYDAQNDPFVAQVIELAELGNVAVKATSLPRYTQEKYPYPRMAGVVREVVEAFTPSRVFWGSDLSLLPCTYGEVRSFFEEEMDFLSSDDLELIMGRGLRQWIGWA